MSTSGRTFLWTMTGGLAALAVGMALLVLTYGESKAQPPSAGEVSTVRGTLDRFTTAPMGEVDGAVLDDGTWLHWPPHLQSRFTDIIKEGDRVRATGRTETGPAGDTHFEVQRVTNLRSDAVAENPDFANGPPTPPDRRRLSLDGAGDTERRLRALEDKVDRLLREVERLRRDR